MFSFPFPFILPEGGTEASLCLQDPEVKGITTVSLRAKSAKLWKNGEQENPPLLPTPRGLPLGNIPL